MTPATAETSPEIEAILAIMANLARRRARAEALEARAFHLISRLRSPS